MSRRRRRTEPAARERRGRWGTVLLALMGLDVGGAETHVLTLARHLQAMGWRVLVASNGGIYQPELEQLQIPHYQLPLHSAGGLALPRSVLGLRSLLRREQVDLIHAHGRIPAFAADCARAGLGIPLLVTAHARFRAPFHLRLLSRWGDRTIAVSPDLRDHLERHFGVPGERIAVIPNGIDTDRFSPQGETDRRKQGDPLLVSLSRLDRQLTDTALALIEAVLLLRLEQPGIRLLLAGAGEGREEVTQRAQAVNQVAGVELVTFVGALPAVAPLLRTADLVVGVSRAAMEAMACARPVLLAGGEGMAGLLLPSDLAFHARDNFTARQAGAPVNPEALAGGIRRYLALTPRERTELGRQLRGFVLEHCSSREMVRATVAVYYSLLRANAPPGEAKP